MKKMLRRMKNENGAVTIVEASIMYPIVIFVVMIFFFLGSLFYQQAKVEAITVRAAEKLAAYYTTPLLYQGIPTSSENLKLDPYRYLFGSSGAEDAVKNYIRQELSKTGDGGYDGTEINATEIVCEVDNYVIYHTARVKISYTIDFQLLKLIGIDSLRRNTVASATSAGDPAEFMRNIDMIIDYADATGLSQKIKDTLDQFT